MKYETTDQVAGLRCRTITHVAVSGKEMHYLRIWNDDDNNSVLVNIGKTTFEKICKLVILDNIQEGGNYALDNSSQER